MDNGSSIKVRCPAPRPALRPERDYVAEVQRRAQELAATAAVGGSRAAGAKIAVQQQRNREVMATLRAETVEVRRLTADRQRVARRDDRGSGDQVMTQELKTGAKAGNQSHAATRDAGPAARRAFNPLHPSMELPPEQLIRLLSLDTGKTGRSEPRPSRRPTPSPRPSQRPPHRPLPPKAQQATQPPVALPTPIHPERSYAAAARAAPRKRRRSLLPAIGLSLILGLAVSGYLFLYRGVSVGATSGPERGDSAPETTQRSQQEGEARPAPATAQTAGKNPSVGRTASRRADPALTPKAAGRERLPTGRATSSPDPDREAARDAERLRLRAEAEKRFAERLASREKDSPAPGTPDETPAAP